MGLAAQRQKDETKETEGGGPRGTRAQPQPSFVSLSTCIYDTTKFIEKKIGNSLLLGTFRAWNAGISRELRKNFI